MLLWAVGYEVQRVVAAVPYFLLMLAMSLGPIVRIWPSIIKKLRGSPVNVRPELGIWFTIWSVAHVLFVWGARDWDVIGYLVNMSPWAFGALVAVIIAIILTATSHTAALKFMGVKAWKWLQSHGAYVILWLTAVHIYDRAYLRPCEAVGFPSNDPIHWAYLLTLAVVVVLQLTALVKMLVHYRKTGNYPVPL